MCPPAPPPEEGTRPRALPGRGALHHGGYRRPLAVGGARIPREGNAKSVRRFADVPGQSVGRTSPDTMRISREPRGSSSSSPASVVIQRERAIR